MLKLVISPQALSDLEDIFDYTVENWSYGQAIKYTSIIDSCFDDLSSGKIEGRDYHHSIEIYKMIKSGKHIIFYRLENEKCIIIRILHEKMDFDSAF
jgi:toxin ParE1/3/4